jgi:pilus assembly protein CpaE
VNASPSLLVAVDEGIDSEIVRAALPPEYENAFFVHGFESAWEGVPERQTDLLVVACGGEAQRALKLIGAATSTRPERPVIAVYDGAPNGFVALAFGAGADDIVTLPAPQEQIRFTFEKVLARRQTGSPAAATQLSPLICVVGPKGGTGKTLTVCNLAVALARAGRRVVAVDLDLQFGDLGLALRLTPERTIYDLVRAGGSLDTDKVDGFLAEHPSGARILLAPARPDQARAVEPAFLRDLYTALRGGYDYVVVDTPSGFAPESIASIDTSSHVCLVAALDSLSLKDARLGLETLQLMGYDESRIRLILNRAGSRVGITLEDVEAVLGRRPDVLVPSERDIPRAVNEGVPIVVSKPRSGAARAYTSLAQMYIDEEPEAEDARVRMRRRFRRWKAA